MQGVQPPVGLTQLPVQWVLGHLPPTVKRPRHEADDSPHLVPKLGISQPTPPCLPCAFMACRGTNLTTRFLTAVPVVANLLCNGMLCDLADTHQRLRYWRWFCLRDGGSTFLRNVCRLLSVAWRCYLLLVTVRRKPSVLVCSSTCTLIFVFKGLRDEFCTLSVFVCFVWCPQ